MVFSDCTIHFPDVKKIEQGLEYFFVERDGKRETIHFHDYDKIYDIPGLYEHLFYDIYQCNSPEVVCSLLKEQMNVNDGSDDKLSVLDIGAGNGMVGEKLAEMGAGTLVGIDIIQEARAAAERDRPGLYEEYYVADLTRLPEPLDRERRGKEFNCMTVVAALGFDDIPPAAFAGGYNIISPEAWVAFNIKEDFVRDDDCTGFQRLFSEMTDAGVFEIQSRDRYRHRLCQDGRPLYYHAIVGRKMADVPESMLAAVA